jgi:hypothetical protein
MAISGHKVQFGVDTLTNPALIQGRVLNFDSVNRAYRGAVNDTRPPFQLLNLVFNSDEEREQFEKGSLTGIQGYNAYPPYTRSQLIVTVDTAIFAGQIVGNDVHFTRIYNKLDKRYMMQFITQAESLVIFTDGKNEALYWNGQTTEVKKVSESKYVKGSMPIGNITLYAHGRLWILTESGILYVGDHLYSQGIDASDEVVLSFSETQYPESGDGFTAPASWGDSRALSVIPRDPSTNGHGEVICWHVYGAYAVNPLDNRGDWTESNIQQTVLTGIGCASPDGVVTINNDLIFRKSDKRIASFRQAVYEKQNSLQNKQLGNDVIKYLEMDSFENLIFTMSGTDDERLFFTVFHQVEDNIEYETKRKFANGFVVLDLASGTSASPDTTSWDGLWTGPRVTGITSLLIGTEKIGIFASYDKDGINRLYKIRKFRGNDILSTGESRIKSMYSFGNMFDGLSVDSNQNPVQTSLTGNILFYSDCVGKCLIESDYRSTFSKRWYSLFSEREIGLEPWSESFVYDLVADSIATGSPDSIIEKTKKQVRMGLAFDVRLKIEGSVAIKSNLLVGDQSQMSTVMEIQCKKDEIDSIEDNYNHFQYQF